MSAYNANKRELRRQRVQQRKEYGDNLIKASVHRFRSFSHNSQVGDLVFVQKVKGWRPDSFFTAIILQKLTDHKLLVFWQDTLQEETLDPSIPKVLLTPRQFKKYFYYDLEKSTKP